MQLRRRSEDADAPRASSSGSTTSSATRAGRCAARASWTTGHPITARSWRSSSINEEATQASRTTTRSWSSEPRHDVRAHAARGLHRRRAGARAAGGDDLVGDARARTRACACEPAASCARCCRRIVGLTQSSAGAGQRRCEVLQNGDGFFPPLFATSPPRSESMHIETLHLVRRARSRSSSRTLLAAKARQGVEVRVLVDASGGTQLKGDDAEDARRRRREGRALSTRSASATSAGSTTATTAS